MTQSSERLLCDPYGDHGTQGGHPEEFQFKRWKDQTQEKACHDCASVQNEFLFPQTLDYVLGELGRDDGGKYDIQRFEAEVIDASDGGQKKRDHHDKHYPRYGYPVADMRRCRRHKEPVPVIFIAHFHPPFLLIFVAHFIPPSFLSSSIHPFRP